MKRFFSMRAAVAIALLAVAALATAGFAHDTWVQTNTNLVRVGDAVHVDLLLGNHGNDHRDFRLAGKVPLDGAALETIDPQGNRFDLKPGLADTGYAPQEGFWTARFAPAFACVCRAARINTRFHVPKRPTAA